MARYEHLKIYKAMFDFMVYYTKIMTNFQKDYKHTLGQRLLDTIADAIVEIYKINDVKDTEARLEHASLFQEKLQYINLYIRLAYGVHAINSDKYNNCCNLMLDVEKQLAGWKNYMQNKLNYKSGEEIQEEDVFVQSQDADNELLQPL